MLAMLPQMAAPTPEAVVAVGAMLAVIPHLVKVDRAS
jgi:hypothetical protein